MTTLEICKVPNYKVNYDNSKKVVKPIKELCDYLQNDFQLHERLNKDNLLKLAVDIDKMKHHNSGATFDRIIADICQFVKVESEDISYTTNFSVPSGSHHIVISKYYMKSSDQKIFWKQFREKYGYGKEIDADIFDKSGWFRLPNQTKEGVAGTEHIIQKGQVEDFVLKYVEKSTEYQLSIMDTPMNKKQQRSLAMKNEDDDDTDKESVASVRSTSGQGSAEEPDKYLELLNIIGNNLEWNDWFKVAGALKYNDYDFKIFDDFSKKSKVFNERTTKQLWADIKNKTKHISIHTLQNLAKQENSEEYKKWLVKWDYYYISIDDIEDSYKTAVIVSKTLSETLKLCKENWYMLTESQLWKQQKEASFYIINEVRKYIDESNKKIVARISLAFGEEKEKLIEVSKKYLQSYKKISTSGYLNVLTKYLKTLLTDNTFADKLDNNPGKLVFKNGIMDLKTKKFKEGIIWSDFVSDTIPYDYSPSGYEYVKSVLKKILNNNADHLEYFLSIVGYSFVGLPNLEKSLYFMIDKTGLGKGDNGKTFFFDIMTTLMPNYTYKSKSSFLEKSNTKVHKQLALMKGKRLVWLDEMPKEKDTNAELMKELADGNQVENEVMFGTSETLNIMFKLFALSNHIPKINPNESAVYNRYKQVSFNSHFDRTGTRVEDCPEELKFVADASLSAKIKEEYYNEVFNMIIEYANLYYTRKMPKVPQQFLADTKETQNRNDEFGMWFEENCVKSETERVAIKRLASASGMSEKMVKEGMERKGYRYDRELKGLGEDCFGNKYRGGYKGICLIDAKNDGRELKEIGENEEEWFVEEK